ncbi:hypothetical protein TRIATDRAFT_304099 [Trichoderma atroviride IMI 206040]|uniref:Uncharacterized protein n=1 Tax=Hypocrea atroviridis (strain ATCC 20476 / IMI 206040) TaxID=452589 RepID=G9NHT7_HYPAI|nr:uncharacterized protein TRIATDRAFT_304099 [Trichoderma atroviride IMI 206040]EHK49820.1 hypothetical protein TRIATDRAFT_304099 [Trichoderma atroviride IMI 206040]
MSQTSAPLIALVLRSIFTREPIKGASDLANNGPIPARLQRPEISSRPVESPVAAWGGFDTIGPGPDTRAESSLEPTGSLAAQLPLCGIGYACPQVPRIVPSLDVFAAELLPIGLGPRSRGVALLGSVSTKEVHPFRLPPLRRPYCPGTAGTTLSTSIAAWEEGRERKNKNKPNKEA